MVSIPAVTACSLEIRPDLENDEIADWRRRGHRDADARRGARFYPGRWALPHHRDMAPFIPLWNECRVAEPRVGIERLIFCGGRLRGALRRDDPTRHTAAELRDGSFGHMAAGSRQDADIVRSSR